MTGNQYKKAIAALGMTQEAAAGFFGISVRASNGYANGMPVPLPIAKLLRLMVRLDLKPNEVK